MKAVRVLNGIVHFAESKAICPFCERKILIMEVDEKLCNSDNGYIRHKCKCKRFIGITSNIIGDIVAYNLKSS